SARTSFGLPVTGSLPWMNADSRARVAKMVASWKIETAVVDEIGPGIEVMKWSCRLNRPFSLMILDLDTALAGTSALTAMQEEPRLAATPIIVVGGREPTPAELSRVGAASSAVWPATQATCSTSP